MSSLWYCELRLSFAFPDLVRALYRDGQLSAFRVIDVKAIVDLASMPSKEAIFAKLLYLINAPAQQLMGTMNAVGRNLAVVVDQGVKENKFQA